MWAKPRAPPPEKTIPSDRPTSRRASRAAPGSLGSVDASRWRARGVTASTRPVTTPPPAGPSTTRSAAGSGRRGAASRRSRRGAAGRPGGCRGRSRRRRRARRRAGRASASSSARSTAPVPAASAPRTSTVPYRSSAFASDRATPWTGTSRPSPRSAKSDGRVGGALRPPLAWSRVASSRATVPAKWASRSISSSKRSRGSRSSVESRIAWTDAERGAPVRRASSPIAAPGPRTRSVRPSAATARRRPRRTTYISRASSPSRSAQSPASTRRGSASAASAASETSSAPASSGTSARIDLETPIALTARPTPSADRTPSRGP